MNGHTIEDTKRDLDAGLDDPSAADLALTPLEMRQVYEMIRKQYVIEYQKLITYARLNEKVDNAAQAKQQREQAQKIVLQVHELDKDIARLPAAPSPV